MSWILRVKSRIFLDIEISIGYPWFYIQELTGIFQDIPGYGET